MVTHHENDILRRKLHNCHFFFFLKVLIDHMYTTAFIINYEK